MGQGESTLNDRISQLIKIFDQLPDDQAGELLSRLARENPFAAMKIVQRHFGFPDLIYANDDGIANLFEAVSETVLHSALSGAGDELIKRFALQLGTGRARTFIEDVDNWDGPARSIEVARRTVLVKAMMLHRRGLLKMNRPGVD